MIGKYEEILKLLAPQKMKEAAQLRRPLHGSNPI
jgi:hypothetical protein